MTQYVQEKVEKMENSVVAWVFLSLIITLSCVYAYFLNGTIQNIVEAKDTTEAEVIVNYHVGVDDPYGINKRVHNFYAYGILRAVPGMLKTGKD